MESERILGQNHILRHFENAIRMGKISHAYIINGEEGSGKMNLAIHFAKAFLYLLIRLQKFFLHFQLLIKPLMKMVKELPFREQHADSASHVSRRIQKTSRILSILPTKNQVLVLMK